MNKDRDIFSIGYEESSHGESVVSILIILVSVSLLVGVFYFFTGNHKNAEASTIEKLINSPNDFKDNQIVINIPNGFDQVESQNTYIKDILSKNLVLEMTYRSIDDITIVITSSLFEEDVSLMDIFASKKMSADNGVQSMLLNLSQKSPDDIMYEMMYTTPTQKIHSKEKLLKISSNGELFVYLIAIQSDTSHWESSSSLGNDLFSGIAITP